MSQIVKRQTTEGPGSPTFPSSAEDRAPAVVETSRLDVRDARWTRLILPFLLPLGATLTIAVFVLNISRVFLAAGTTGALVMATVMIIVILGGAASISAAPGLRTSSLLMLVSGLFIALIGAGLVAAPASVEKNAAASGYQPPRGAATSTLEVDALASIRFQASQFVVPAGILQINYVSKDGSHTLTFDPPGPAGFFLTVPANGTVSGKVQLQAGHYTIYCSLPGHRQQGMQANLIVR